MAHYNALLAAKTVRCTVQVPQRNFYIVGTTYDVGVANHGGSRTELWIGTKGLGGHMFQPEEAAKHFTPAP
ncbi:MAG: hypothetical protein AAB445_02150 [Patescibacteria group bacterium]